jgi:diguanylate cyclase (GGDEF)-like protein
MAPVQAPSLDPAARPLLTLARSLDRVADSLAEGQLVDLAAPGPVASVCAGDEAEIVAAAERLVAAVRRSHALEAAVHELFEAMSSHLRLDYLSYEALNRVIDHTRALGGAVVLAATPPDVVASAEFDLDAERVAALMAGVPDELGPTQLAVPEGESPMVAVPFVGDAGPLGAVLLIGVRLDGEMERLLALLARALGFAVSNAIAHAAVERQAGTDPLTGCSNRRAGLAALAQSARVAALGGPPVGALMIDLDRFKGVNDRYGHQVGDDLLQAAGVTIAGVLRDNDLVVRYGGEEFLVAVSGPDDATIVALAERIRAAVGALAVPDGAGGVIAATASIGVAAWSRGDSAETLIARADRAVYAAKAAGRDRVVLAPGA